MEQATPLTKGATSIMETTTFTTTAAATPANELVDGLWRLAAAILPDGEAMRFEGGDNGHDPINDREAFVALLLGLASTVNISGLCDGDTADVRSRIGCLGPALRHFGWEAK